MGADNNLNGISATGNDVSEKQKLIDMLKESEEKYRTLFSSIAQGAALHEIIVDNNNVPIDYRFIDMNDSFQKILNIKAEDYIGKTLLEVLPGTEKYWIENFGEVALSGKPFYFKNYSTEFNRYFETYAFSYRKGQFTVLITDITERNLNEIKNTMIDGLTEVYNRRYIDEKLPADVNESIINRNPLSVIMADIDYLKDVNDKYGNSIGDRIIKDYAKIINNLVRKNLDWVGRYGGDKFIIVLKNVELENAFSIAEKMRKIVKKTIFKYNDVNIKITSSFGVYCTEDEKWDIENILTEVDKNLNEAKRKGRDRTIMNNDIKMNAIQLSILNKRIQELRENLNEVCISTTDVVNEEQKLKISEYLDKLIVEYMKNIDYK